MLHASRPRAPRASALALALLLAACTDSPGPAAPEPPAQPAPPRVNAIRCTATVATRALDCVPETPAGGASLNVLLGGQGTNVRLASSNVAYAAGVLGADVTVQNLLAQPMGTNGAATTGVRVFFASGPTTTAGTGTVEVRNADGVGTFTGGSQPYFEYPGILPPRGISTPKRWEFDAPAGVTSFEFLVYVETPLPSEGAVLHWRPEHGATIITAFDDVFTLSATSAFAVDDDGSLAHWDGNYWTEVCPPNYDEGLEGVWAASPTDVWAVGRNGRILRYDGRTCTHGTYHLAIGEGFVTDFTSVWGSGPNDVWIVGQGIVLHWDGTQFSETRGPSFVDVYSDDYRDVWGTGPSDVWVAGDVVVHWDGTEWTQVEEPHWIFGGTVTAGWSPAPGVVWTVTEHGSVVHRSAAGTWSTEHGAGHPLHAVWASPSGEVFAGGDSTLLRRTAAGVWAPTSGVETARSIYGLHGAADGTLFASGIWGALLRWDGAAWQMQSRADFELNAVWGASAADVWAVGDSGTVLRRAAGGAWLREAGATTQPLHDVWGASANDVWAVGDAGTIVRRVSGGWSLLSALTPQPLRGIHGTPARAFAVGGAGTILRYESGSWSTMASGTAWTLRSVWMAADSVAFAVGEGGTILRWNGSAWTPMTSGTTQDLAEVWGTSPTDVWAVGNHRTALHFDGVQWSPVPMPLTPNGAGYHLHSVWGAGPADVYAVTSRGELVLHYDGAAWKVLTDDPGDGYAWLGEMWGTSGRDVFAVGTNGLVLHGTR